MEHHADFAVPITHRLWIESKVRRPGGVGVITGWALALGWWVEPNVDEQGEPGPATGTLYLVVDEHLLGPPVWIAEGNIARCRIDPM